MTKPDDFTVSMLHCIQNERTAPGNGWLSTGQIARGMGLTTDQALHVEGPLKELHEAGMIEKRWNAVRARDEWRSRGVQPDIRHSITREEAAAEFAEQAMDDALDPAPSTIFPAPIKGIIHAAFVLDYRTDRWATMCGKQVKDPSTVEHRRMPVQCRPCAEALR